MTRPSLDARGLRAWLLGIGLSLPIGVLLASYAAIAWHTGNPWPWLEVVHEAGDRSLLGTVFYFEHAARELPLDLLLGIGVAGSVLFAFPARPATDRVATARAIRRTASALALTTAVIVVGTLATEGAHALLDNLMQMHTRPGEPLRWGSHWRYHLLSRASLLLLAFGLAGACLWLAGDGSRPAGGLARGLQLFGAAGALFVIATVVFAPDRDPFVDPVFLGHQVRETMTHALVTVPLAWAACLWLADPEAPPGDGVRAATGWALGAGAVGAALVLYLGVRALATSAASQGQTTDPILLVAPHFFEHGFTYVVVPLTAMLAYRTASASASMSASASTSIDSRGPSSGRAAAA